MTEIGLIRNNKKKTNKISQISYFFPTHFPVHRKVRCPSKVAPKPTSTHIYNMTHGLNPCCRCIGCLIQFAGLFVHNGKL